MKIRFKSISICFLAMTNQDTLREIQRGYRLEKPNYPLDVSPDKLNGIYGVRVIFSANIALKIRWEVFLMNDYLFVDVGTCIPHMLKS